MSSHPLACSSSSALDRMRISSILNESDDDSGPPGIDDGNDQNDQRDDGAAGSGIETPSLSNGSPSRRRRRNPRPSCKKYTKEQNHCELPRYRPSVCEGPRLLAREIIRARVPGGLRVVLVVSSLIH
jgi:hypothetical protein